MRWTPNRVVTLYLGLGFFFLGALSMFAAPTLRESTWAIYKIDVVINLVHMGAGAIGLLAVFTGWSRLYNRICGIFFTLLGVIGLIPVFTFNDHRLLGVTHVNLALSLTQLVVGLVALTFSFFLSMYGSWTVPARTAL